MSLNAEVELLRGTPIFGTIVPAIQKLLCFTSERLTYDAGQVLFGEGEAADAAYVLVSGVVEIAVQTLVGRLRLNTLGRNDVFGETGVLAGVPRTATATAKCRVEVLRISKELFRKIVQECPGAALRLNEILARRLADTTGRLGAAAVGASG